MKALEKSRIVIFPQPNKAYIYMYSIVLLRSESDCRLSDSVVHRRFKFAMDRSQFILIGLPIFLFCSDLFNLFTPPPPKPPSHRPNQPPHIPHQQRPPVVVPGTLDFPSQVKPLCVFPSAVVFFFVISQSLSYVLFCRSQVG